MARRHQLSPRHVGRALLVIVTLSFFIAGCRPAPGTVEATPPPPAAVAAASTAAATQPATAAPAETVTPALEPTSGATATAAAAATAPAAETATASATTAPGAAATGVATDTLATATAATTHTLATIDMLDSIVLPRRDAVQLAVEYGRTASPERVARTQPLPAEVGSSETFWMSNIAEHTHYTTTATLELVLDHVLMYVQDGREFDRAALERSARDFNDRIYPRNRELFGEEWSPGVDGDPRITILNARIGDGAAGYFSGSDEVPRSVNRFSNEREMFYMDIEAAPLGTDYYSLVLAHEFQHMIAWNQSKHSPIWLNEGLAQLAEELNGFADPGLSGAFIAMPDVQLTDWSDLAEEPAETSAHYGAAYLFLSYFYEHYGRSLDLKALVREGGGDLDTFAEQARTVRPDIDSFEELFADWAVANLIDDEQLEQGRWSYRRLADVIRTTTRADSDLQGDVAQYGADYIELPPGAAERVFHFDGSDDIGVVATDPEGSASWWSNRADNAMSTLTGRFDLTSLRSATLQFRLWFDIEKDYDYGFVSISKDGGKTWQTLPGRHTTTEDPQGANYGHGFTGTSGGEEAHWVDESIDLTPFAGQPVLIRFSLVTDDALNEPGMLLDNIRIPELGFADDAEQNAAVWQSSGWVRTNNELPQGWQLRVVRYTGGARAPVAQVEPISPDAQGRAEIRLAPGERAVLVVSATTPHTSERASYTIGPTLAPASGAYQRPAGH